MGKIRQSEGMVVRDAGSIIHLDELHCLLLLDDFGEIIIPHAVYEEILLHRESCLAKTKMHLVKHPATLPLDERLLTMCQVFSLHAGEMEALAEMEAHPDALFLTDDCAARLVAERMNYTGFMAQSASLSVLSGEG